VSHFAGSRGTARDTLIRRFAFKLMDVRGTGAVDQVRSPFAQRSLHARHAPCTQATHAHRAPCTVCIGAAQQRDMERFVEVAYEMFTQKQRPSAGWGDTVGVRARAEMDVKTCMTRISAACGSDSVPWNAFEGLVVDLPLLVAPAAFIWTTFEGAARSGVRWAVLS
jgi:hypothetical protein